MVVKHQLGRRRPENGCYLETDQTDASFRLPASGLRELINDFCCIKHMVPELLVDHGGETILVIVGECSGEFAYGNFERFEFSLGNDSGGPWWSSSPFDRMAGVDEQRGDGRIGSILSTAPVDGPGKLVDVFLLDQRC